MLLSAVLMNWLLLFYKQGIGLIIFLLLEILLFEIAKRIYNKKFKVTKFHLLIIPILFFGLTFVFRADSFVLFWNKLMLLILVPLYIFTSSNPKFFKNYSENEVLELFARQISSIGNIFRIKKPTENIKEKEIVKIKKVDSKVITKLIIAFAITIPLVTVVIALLASADEVFAEVIKNIITGLLPNISIESTFNIIFSLIFMFFGWSYIKGYIDFDESQTKRQVIALLDKMSLDVIIPAVLTYALNIVFLIFIIIQFDYLLFGEDFARKHDIIFSEYAIKGFWEMILVLLINYVTLYFVQTRFSLRDLKAKLILIPSYSFMLFASVVMLFSSHIRLNIYEDAYGYTRDRLIPHIFLICIALLLVLVFINSFLNNKIRKKTLIIGTFIMINIFFMIFSLISMDSIVVNQNMKKYSSIKYDDPLDLDLKYLYNELGVEGTIIVSKRFKEGEFDEYFANYTPSNKYDRLDGRFNCDESCFKSKLDTSFSNYLNETKKGGWRSWTIQKTKVENSEFNYLEKASEG